MLEICNVRGITRKESSLQRVCSAEKQGKTESVGDGKLGNIRAYVIQKPNSDKIKQRTTLFHKKISRPTSAIVKIL